MAVTLDLTEMLKVANLQLLKLINFSSPTQV